MTTTLVLIAHGSRNQRSNDEVRALCARLSSTAAVAQVSPAFLELAEPTLLDTVQSVVDTGCTRILVLPYFLNSGLHVTRDVPELVQQARDAQPGITIELMNHIGGTQAFLDALESIVAGQVGDATSAG